MGKRPWHRPVPREGVGRMRITINDYWMGRDAMYPAELTPEIMRNAGLTVAKANSLLAVLEAEGVGLEEHPRTKSLVSSGWRSPQINGQVKGAAPKSKHMTGQAIDIYDPEGEIDDYLMTDAGQRMLVSLALWMEHPSATKGWTHIQTVAPRSERRVFYP
jgi:hypothetical protein